MVEKTYGKQKIYFASQSNQPKLSKEELDALDDVWRAQAVLERGPPPLHPPPFPPWRRGHVAHQMAVLVCLPGADGKERRAGRHHRTLQRARCRCGRCRSAVLPLLEIALTRPGCPPAELAKLTADPTTEEADALLASVIAEVRLARAHRGSSRCLSWPRDGWIIRLLPWGLAGGEERGAPGLCSRRWAADDRGGPEAHQQRVR